METMAGLGATRFLEVGHGTMLAGLAKRTTPAVPVHNVATPHHHLELIELSETRA
jgi:malonyl CoA-acyl carrier protein transacylase